MVKKNEDLNFEKTLEELENIVEFAGIRRP